jgi:hypothetical protein
MIVQKTSRLEHVKKLIWVISRVTRNVLDCRKGPLIDKRGQPELSDFPCGALLPPLTNNLPPSNF